MSDKRRMDGWVDGKSAADDAAAHSSAHIQTVNQEENFGVFVVKYVLISDEIDIVLYRASRSHFSQIHARTHSHSHTDIHTNGETANEDETQWRRIYLIGFDKACSQKVK